MAETQRYYEHLYAAPREYVRDPTFVGLVHSMLRRWEGHRSQVVSALLRPGGTFLDVGCGDGDLLMRNLDRYERLHGTDIASNRVARARNSSASHVLVNVANLDAGLPYADSVFDVAACLAVLEHVFDPYLLVGELVRVLKPGGQLIVEVPNLAFLAHRVALLLGKLPRTAFNEPGWDGGHLHYFTFGALKELLTSNGIRVSGECCAGIGHRLRSLRPQLLGADIILVGFKA